MNAVDLSAFEQRIGYVFARRELLEQAITHPSYLQDHPSVVHSNQRLEFLGDAVLQLVLTQELFVLYPEEREGALSKRRSALTKGATLAELGKRLELQNVLRLSASEESTGGRTRTRSLEDAFEALVGAIFLDSDLATTRRIVLSWYGSISDRLEIAALRDNPKGRLQELVQPEHGNSALRYEVTAIEGEDHARMYHVTVLLNEQPIGTGRGTSKKSAEEEAAREALQRRP